MPSLNSLSLFAAGAHSLGQPIGQILVKKAQIRPHRRDWSVLFTNPSTFLCFRFFCLLICLAILAGNGVEPEQKGVSLADSSIADLFDYQSSDRLVLPGNTSASQPAFSRNLRKVASYNRPEGLAGPGREIHMETELVRQEKAEKKRVGALKDKEVNCQEERLIFSDHLQELEVVEGSRRWRRGEPADGEERETVLLEHELSSTDYRVAYLEGELTC
ncbi:unnamed protein product [Protopolystoma xenopodis]|uniref:Uncharacterized protein n=1 Tax=Protopolystoma xenopodis TaxID=117903 RepID=A0A3S5B6D3_9PLAT|nr:unnamed protein product [Protopolystoma xenopodis]